MILSLPISTNVRVGFFPLFLRLGGKTLKLSV